MNLNDEINANDNITNKFFIIVCYNKSKDHTIENKHNDIIKWNEDGKKG